MLKRSTGYLKTNDRGVVNDYRDWGIQLGRRFRALKLWFVIRSFGVEGLQRIIHNHILWAKELEEHIIAHPDFELLYPRQVNLLCFRYRPLPIMDEMDIDSLNKTLVDTLNMRGNMYLTHTKVFGKYTIRLVGGNTNLERRHIQEAWSEIKDTAAELKRKNEE